MKTSLKLYKYNKYVKIIYYDNFIYAKYNILFLI